MNKKIMIVDDDSDILIFLRTLFEQHHFEVLTVDSGDDCIEELERGFKGIVLMDLMMPFMDGWDTIKEIIKRGLNKNIIISIITANRNPDPEKIKGLESYIYDYIPKPFDLQKLLIDIENITSSKKDTYPPIVSKNFKDN
jgi:DNA-binding response OmpR family regulator